MEQVLLAGHTLPVDQLAMLKQWKELKTLTLTTEYHPIIYCSRIGFGGRDADYKPQSQMELEMYIDLTGQNGDSYNISAMFLYPFPPCMYYSARNTAKRLLGQHSHHVFT